MRLASEEGRLAPGRPSDMVNMAYPLGHDREGSFCPCLCPFLYSTSPPSAPVPPAGRRCSIRWSSPAAVDELGYTRYWLAEHHNMPAIASSAPEILIGQVATVTQRIRVGAGGIMLPNHALESGGDVPHVGSAVPRPDRPGHRPGAGHRPRHGPRPAGRTGVSGGGRVLRPSWRICSISPAGRFRPTTLSAASSPCPTTCRCRPSGCWDPAISAPASPPGWG